MSMGMNIKKTSTEGEKNSTSFSLTDQEGNITTHINLIFMQVIKFIKLQIKVLYVFDNEVPHQAKLKELEKRKKIRDINEHNAMSCVKFNAIDINAEISNSDCIIDEYNMQSINETKINSLGCFRITSKMINDVKQLLTLMGIPWIESPPEVDAEHVCAILNKNNIVDYIITTDADCILYGALSVLKYENQKLILYTRASYLNLIDEEFNKFKLKNKKQTELNLSIEDKNKILLLSGIFLGTDFNDKVQGVGKGTVIKKSIDAYLNNKVLNEEQIIALNIFTNVVKIPHIPNYLSIDKQKLLIYFKSKSFNLDRINKMLKSINV
jgi:flap endonuclease-1